MEQEHGRREVEKTRGEERIEKGIGKCMSGGKGALERRALHGCHGSGSAWLPIPPNLCTRFLEYLLFGN